MTTPLRIIVAVTLQTIDADDGYISPQKSGTANTQAKVHNAIKNNVYPTLNDEYYWRLADRIIDYFQKLPSLPEYKSIMERSDAASFQTCIDVSGEVDVLPVSFPFAVQMPHVYSKLKPMTRNSIDPSKLDTVITKPGEYMGKLHTTDRFFVMLYAVGDYDASKGGNVFQVRDRNHNIGFFYERPDKLRGEIFLGDCFVMIATPSRHAPTDDGEKHTVFRGANIIDNKGHNQVLPAANDLTGMFQRV